MRRLQLHDADVLWRVGGVAKKRNGSNMTLVMNVTGTNTYAIINTTLPGTFSNNPQTKIIYRCLSSAGNEFCRIDNVLVSGTPVPATPDTNPNITNATISDTTPTARTPACLSVNVSTFNATAI